MSSPPFSREKRRPSASPPPQKGELDVKVVIGGVMAILVLALGGYAYATFGSDGESNSRESQGPFGRVQGTEGRKDLGEPGARGESNEPDGVVPEQGEGIPGTERIPKSESPDASGPSEHSPDGSITGYIAQLGSFTRRAGAETRLRRLASRGLAVGILRSDDYPQMAPGYWVVYSGPFDSKALADSAAESSGIQDAFSREISPV